MMVEKVKERGTIAAYRALLDTIGDPVLLDAMVDSISHAVAQSRRRLGKADEGLLHAAEQLHQARTRHAKAEADRKAAWLWTRQAEAMASDALDRQRALSASVGDDTIPTLTRRVDLDLGKRAPVQPPEPPPETRAEPDPATEEEAGNE